MRLGILYSAVLVFSLTAWALVQYGWRPPFVLWDGRSVVYLGCLCFLLSFASTAGLGLLAPTNRLPPHLRQVPPWAAIFLVVMVFIGITNLTPDLTLWAAVKTMSLAAGLGALTGTVIGLISGTWPAQNAEKVSIEDQRRRILIALPVIAFGGMALLLFPRPRDDAHFQAYGRYGTASSFLEIGLSTGPLDAKHVVIRICEDGARSMLVFDHNDWTRVSGLIESAERIQSATWRAAGEIHDTAAPGATLHLSSGPGMRFTITSPYDPRVEYTLSRVEFERFQTDVARVTHDVID
jgi:hypothetical protein